MTPLTPERLEAIRQAAIAGTASIEDMQEYIRHLRAGRMSAVKATTAKREAATKPVVDGDALLDGLL